MNPQLCPTCHVPIPLNSPGGFCPACLLRAAEDIPTTGRAAPSLEEIAAGFPQFEIVRLIGQGGMGFVYQARQPGLDRTVALKILSPELGRDPAFAERFAREARVLGKLNHPNIVTVFEHGESGGFFYLLMEYVDGVNLRQAMRAGRFTPEQALAIVPPVCDALQAAHAQGIWHRDIKPENILLDARGGVKIADFGIARIVGDPQRDFTLTLTGGVLGSAAYMAPEQHETPRNVDHRADIYSLGVVIYEMLTGELPLGRFPSPSQRAAVNARIDEIVLRTLEKERELRQQSADEVKTDVQGVGNPTAQRSLSLATVAKPRVSFFGPAALIAGGVFLQFIGRGLGQPYETAAIVVSIIGRFSVALGVVVAILAIYERKPRMWVAISGVIVGLATITLVAVMSAPLMTVGLMAAAMVFGVLGLVETRHPDVNGAIKENGLRQQGEGEAKTEVQEADHAPPISTPDAATEAEPANRHFRVVLSMWLGGIVTGCTGMLTSPLLLGLGIISAVLGLGGCWWLLWRIHKGAHPPSHRLPLLATAFWPMVAGIAWAGAAFWFVHFKRFSFHVPSDWNALLGYAFLAIAVPLLAAGFLWKWVGANPTSTSSPWNQGTRLTLAVLLAIGSVGLVKFVSDRERSYRSYRSTFIQVYGDIHETEDLPLIREALDRALGDSRSDFRVRVLGARDSSKPPSIARVESPYIILECAATDIDGGLQQERFRAIDGRLRASLPKRIRFHAGGGGGWGSLDDEDAPISIREGYRNLRPLNSILLLAPIAMVLLAGTLSFRVIWLAPVIALLTATVLRQSSWPGIPDGLPPSIDMRKALPPLPLPEYDFSTTRDAMESLVKAAKKGDPEAFKRGISSKLLENILSQLPDLTEPMRDVVNQSYAGQISLEGDVSTVNMSDKTGALTVVPLVRENGDWKVDLPAKDRSERNLLSEPLGFPKTEVIGDLKRSALMVHVENVPILTIVGSGTYPLAFGGSCGPGRLDGKFTLGKSTIDMVMRERNKATIGQKEYDLKKGRVLLVRPDGTLRQINKPLDHVLENDELEQFMDSLPAEPMQTSLDADSPAKALTAVLDAARNRNARIFQEGFSKSFKAELAKDGEKLDFGDFGNCHWISTTKLDETHAESVVEADDGSKRRFTFRMILEDGAWKVDALGSKP